MIAEYIKNDTRVFKIKPFLNPHKRTPFKIMRQSLKRDGRGDKMKDVNGRFVTQEMQVDSVLAPGVKHRFTPSRRRDNGQLLTGLDVVVKNEYKDADYYTNEAFEKVLKGKDRVKLQHVLEYEHGVPFDFYTANIPEGLLPKNVKERRFFELPESSISLGNDVLYLRMNNPRDRVLYYAMTARHKDCNIMVAINRDEISSNPKAAYCMWHFLDEEETQSAKLSSLERKNKIAFAIETIKNSKKKDDIINVAKALEIEDARDLKLSGEKAYILINDYAASAIERGNFFLELFDTYYQDKVRKNELEAFAEIFDFVNYGVVGYRNGKYEVQYKDQSGALASKIFNTKTEFARGFIMDPLYKETVEILRDSLRSKND